MTRSHWPTRLKILNTHAALSSARPARVSRRLGKLTAVGDVLGMKVDDAAEQLLHHLAGPNVKHAIEGDA